VILALWFLLLTIWLQSVRAESGLTTRDRSKNGLSHVVANLDEGASDRFALGRSFFHVPWVQAPAATTARDGLGPLFNANSCASCHPNNGGGDALPDSGHLPRSTIVKLAQPAVNRGSLPHNGFIPDPVYGQQLSINGNSRVPFEGQVEVTLKPLVRHFSDGSAITLARPEIRVSSLNYGPLSESTRLLVLRAPSLVGLGLIERIPDAQILQYQDERDTDADGISGRVNRVWSMQHQDYRLGRYGWKANTSSVREQVSNALINDMSLTSPWYPEDNCGEQQQACLEAYRSPEPDVPMTRLQAINDYLLQLRAPVVATDDKEQERRLFESTGCLSCHRVGYRTNNGVVVNPYSDFLLHDMGPELSAGSGVFKASAQEWRTPPLWGLGLAKLLNPDAGYLHDGRARTLQQAIMWHDGEAAASQREFAALDRNERDVLIKFLRSL
jgi:CxxC motif-containing protein (DUF1111 family)